MDPKKVGLAAASLLGAATLLTATPAHADEVIICPCTVPSPGADPFHKIETNFSKLLVKFDEGSTQFNKIEGAFLKIHDVFFKVT